MTSTRRQTLAIAGAALASVHANAAGSPSPSAPIPLWPKGTPGETGGIGEERDMTKPGQDRPGRHVIRLGNVTNPAMTVYFPPREKETGTAVAVFPGGGYNILALDLEGMEICEWLNSLGVTAILVKYRVPVRAGLPRHVPPLQDAQRALGLIRSRASEWRINPNRIGVIGFSAGGHLSATVSNNFEKRTYEPVDEADRVSCRPDFTMLIYPAYLTLKEDLTRLAPELPVTSNTPPAFLIQTEDDGVHVENSLVYYRALKDAKVPAEMHLFASGGHGYGRRPSANPVAVWPALGETWLRSRGLIAART